MLTLKLAGSIDEEMALAELKVGQYEAIVIDVGGINFINSVGSREWVKWMKEVGRGSKLSFINCPKIFIDQTNMIEGFVPPNASIDSFLVPYFCNACETQTPKTFATADIRGKSDKVPEFTVCSGCGKKAEIDVIPSTFFKFLNKAKGKR